MNRTIFISIVGLGVLSAVGFAGSRAQSASIATCQSTTPSAPVVVVTQPDGNRLVATCVSVSACDPSAKSRGASTVYTFTPAQGGTAALTASGAGAAGVSGQAPEGTCSTTGSAASVAGGGSTVSTTSGEKVLGHRYTLRAAQQAEPAVVHVPSTAPVELQSPIGLRNLLAAQHPRAYSLDLSEGTVTPLVHADEDATAEWRVEVERALAEARESLTENQDEMREAWQRAAEEARIAQERAREVYDQAMETYRDAMRKAQERSREALEHANAERRAQADRGARKARSGMRSDANARSEHESTLESRIAALEKAARGRGLDVDADSSIEERVAKLEKHMSKGSTPLFSELFARPQPGKPAVAPEPPKAPKPPKAMRLKRATPPAPAAPGIPAPPHEGTPGQPPAQPFMWRRGDAEGGAQGTFARKPMSDDDREQMTRAMEDLKREAARLREELARMRAEVDRLPRSDGGR